MSSAVEFSTDSATAVPPTKEEIALAELRTRIIDLTDDPKLTEDLYLLAWLKSSSFKVAKAEKALRDSVSWRKENHMDDLLNQPEDEEIAKKLPISLESTSKDGEPLLYVWIDELHKLDRNRIIQHLYRYLMKLEQCLLDYNNRKYKELCEKEKRKVPITSEMTVKTSLLVDCKNFHLSDLRSPRLIQAVLDCVRNYVSYFPALCHTAYYFNANKFYEVFLKLMKPILSLSGMKIESFDSNAAKWSPILLDFIEADQLPVEWGGTKIFTGV